MILNFNYIPNYGDTQEYLDIARSPNLPLDLYRGCVFPMILRLCIRMENLAGIPFHHVLYAINLCAGIFATAFFCATVHDTLRLHSKPAIIAGGKPGFVIFFTMLIQSIPLFMHFHMSVLSDSLAASLTLAFLAASIRMFAIDCRKYAIPTVVLFVLASLARPERFIFIVLFFLIVIIIFALKIPRHNSINSFLIKAQKQTIIVAMIAFFIATSLTIITIKMTQAEIMNRMPPSAEYFMYERIVKNRLAQLYPMLPANITRSISYEDALHYDSNPNYYRYAVLKLVLEDSGEVKKIKKINQLNFKRVNQVTWLALKTYPVVVVREIFRDILYNLFSPYIDLFAHYANKSIDAIGWTESRMGEAHPILTREYLRYYKLLFLLLSLYLFTVVCTKKISFAVFKNQTGIMIIAWMLISAIGYGLTGSQSYHIRYTLPCYLQVVFFTYLFVCSVTWQRTSKALRPALDN